MTAFVPAQLHPLLGPDLASIDEQKLSQLVGLPEAEWLDAKRDRYGTSDNAKRELASDVAALANRRGGIIVIGLNEQDSTISALAPLDDESIIDEELRLTQVVASLVSPVPTFAIERVSSAPQGSYLVISVPPSVRRPHSVAVNSETMRYPLREGTHKRYLAESEVADLYHSRFADAKAHIEQAKQRAEHMTTSLDRESQAWLVVSLEPDWKGQVAVSHDTMQNLRSFGTTDGRPFPSYFGSRNLYPSRAFRSHMLSDESDRVRSGSVQLFDDGGGVIAIGFDRLTEDGDRDETKAIAIADEDIVGCLVNSIWSLAHWATDQAGTSGGATLSAEIHAPMQNPMTVWQYRQTFSERLPNARDLQSDSGLVEMTVSLDALKLSPTDLLLTTRRVSADILSAFGVVGPMQITPRGELRRQYFHHGRRGLLDAWAEERNVALVDTEVPA